ncbi:hypothetical protein B0H19DRAFT_1272836 [Mycena capillaripes]|nr:hypothetical protein B0H19DRAFT_1272836 [Mycena capillaripes]
MAPPSPSACAVPINAATTVDLADAALPANVLSLKSFHLGCSFVTNASLHVHSSAIQPHVSEYSELRQTASPVKVFPSHRKYRCKSSISLHPAALTPARRDVVVLQGQRASDHAAILPPCSRDRSHRSSPRCNVASAMRRNYQRQLLLWATRLRTRHTPGRMHCGTEASCPSHRHRSTHALGASPLQHLPPPAPSLLPAPSPQPYPTQPLNARARADLQHNAHHRQRAQHLPGPFSMFPSRTPVSSPPRAPRPSFSEFNTTFRIPQRSAAVSTLHTTHRVHYLLATKSFPFRRTFCTRVPHHIPPLSHPHARLPNPQYRCTPVAHHDYDARSASRLDFHSLWACSLYSSGVLRGTYIRVYSLLHVYEWDYFIDHRKTAAISRKLNNIFSLTALGVYDGDFMKFPDGVAAVTLAGGRTYHRMLPAHEGQHAIRWFIHDPWAMFMKGVEFDIPSSWINSTLAGLERVNPFIAQLENLNIYDDDDDIALHIEYSDSITNEIAAIVSLAPASPPSRRKTVALFAATATWHLGMVTISRDLGW